MQSNFPTSFIFNLIILTHIYTYVFDLQNKNYRSYFGIVAELIPILFFKLSLKWLIYDCLLVKCGFCSNSSTDSTFMNCKRKVPLLWNYVILNSMEMEMKRLPSSVADLFYHKLSCSWCLVQCKEEWQGLEVCLLGQGCMSLWPPSPAWIQNDFYKPPFLHLQNGDNNSHFSTFSSDEERRQFSKVPCERQMLMAQVENICGRENIIWFLLLPVSFSSWVHRPTSSWAGVWVASEEDGHEVCMFQAWPLSSHSPFPFLLPFWRSCGKMVVSQVGRGPSLESPLGGKPPD